MLVIPPFSRIGGSRPRRGLATFYGAATGARMISADEESGYLLLAHPIGRARLLLHRCAALATGAAAIAAAVLAVRSSAGLGSVPVGTSRPRH